MFMRVALLCAIGFIVGIILQPHLAGETSSAALDMEVFGPGLMSSSPTRPVQNGFRLGRSLPDQPPEQSAHFRDG
jgi:hypothetical protein